MHLHLATWPPQKQVEQTLGQAFAQKEAMRLHLAERDPQHHAWAKHGVDKESMQLRILLSYWYYKDVDLDALFAKYFTEPYPEVFADSGAFSAMTQGAPVNIDEYAAWVKRYKHLLQVYANLDVIKDAEATWRNQQYLEDKHGLEPLPAFHVLEDWAWLEHYVSRYPYIALGVAGMQQRKDEVIRWLIQCFKIAGKQAVFHGFALTSWQVMSSFPWYSVDSSSWGQGFRFGQVPLFDSKRGRFYKAGLGDRAGCVKLKGLFTEYGFDWQDFADRKRNDRAKICAISALSYMRAEQWLRYRFGEICIPNQANAPVVLRAHLADANPARYGDVLSDVGERLHLADTSNGINFGDADKGIKSYLVDSSQTPSHEAAFADSGLKIYNGAKGVNEGNQMSPGSQATGLKLHLADSNGAGGGQT